MELDYGLKGNFIDFILKLRQPLYLIKYITIHPKIITHSDNIIGSAIFQKQHFYILYK